MPNGQKGGHPPGVAGSPTVAPRGGHPPGVAGSPTRAPETLPEFHRFLKLAPPGEDPVLPARRLTMPRLRDLLHRQVKPDHPWSQLEGLFTNLGGNPNVFTGSLIDTTLRGAEAEANVSWWNNPNDPTTQAMYMFSPKTRQAIMEHYGWKEGFAERIARAVPKTMHSEKRDSRSWLGSRAIFSKNITEQMGTGLSALKSIVAFGKGIGQGAYQNISEMQGFPGPRYEKPQPKSTAEAIAQGLTQTPPPEPGSLMELVNLLLMMPAGTATLGTAQAMKQAMLVSQGLVAKGAGTPRTALFQTVQRMFQKTSPRGPASPGTYLDELPSPRKLTKVEAAEDLKAGKPRISIAGEHPNAPLARGDAVKLQAYLSAQIQSRARPIRAVTSLVERVPKTPEPITVFDNHVTVRTAKKYLDRLNNTLLNDAPYQKALTIQEPAPVQVEQALEIEKFVNLLNKARASVSAQVQRQKADIFRKVQEAGEVTEKSELRGVARAREFQRSFRGSIEPERFPEIHFPQEQMDRYYDMIMTSSNVDEFQRLRALTGFREFTELQKLPTNSQIDALGMVFGPELSNAFRNFQPLSQKAFDLAMDLINLPRMFLASFDLSFPLRQGIVLLPGKPLVWANSVRTMVKAARTEKGARQIDATFKSDPLHPTFMNAGGVWEEAGALAVGQRAEYFMVRGHGAVRRLIDTLLPPVGLGLKISERAYVTMGNALRFQAFKSYVKELENAGIVQIAGKTKAQLETYVTQGIRNSDPGVIQMRDIARWVNVATGRGTMMGMEEYAPLLGALFFAPRLLASRFQTLAAPVTTSGRMNVFAHKSARRMVTRDLLRFFGSGIMTLTLLKTSGAADVELDPRSSAFGTIRIGSSRIDPWAGFRPLAVLVAQLKTGERKTLQGDFQGVKWTTLLGRFLWSKTSPAAGLVTDLVVGHDFLGRPIGPVPKEFINRMTPLFLQDLKDAIEVEGASLGIAVAAPAFFGTGVVSIPQPLDRLVENMFVNKLGLPVGAYDKERVFKYDQLTPAGKNRIKNTREARVILARSTVSSPSDELKTAAIAEQEERDAQFYDGTMTATTWHDERRKKAIEASERGALFEMTNSWRRNPPKEGTDEWYLQKYYNISEEHEGAAFDVAGYSEAVEEFLDGLTQEQEAYVWDSIWPNATKLEDKYKGHLRRKRELGWSKIYKRSDAYRESSPEVKELYEEYLKAKRRNEEAAWRTERPERQEYITGIINKIEKETTVLQVAVRRANKRFDLGEAFFFGTGMDKHKVPLHIENKVLIARRLEGHRQLEVLEGSPGRLWSGSDRSALIDAGINTLEGIADSTYTRIARITGRSKLTIMRWDPIGQARAILEAMSQSTGDDLLEAL